MKILPAEEVVAHQAARGIFPPEQLPFLQNWVTWDQELGRGGTAWLDPTMEQILGRKPKTVREQSQILFSVTNKVEKKEFVGSD